MELLGILQHPDQGKHHKKVGDIGAPEVRLFGTASEEAAGEEFSPERVQLPWSALGRFGPQPLAIEVAR